MKQKNTAAVAVARKKYGSMSRNESLENKIVYLFLTLGAVIMIIPLVWMFELRASS